MREGGMISATTTAREGEAAALCGGVVETARG